ncbi:Fic family protein [Pseudoxanthomonas winnipegensis]|jgi:hypothetical protein|uniref:Fic family protein n=1 Tax=Pseudoxanthomonas winnipegensis TaxID=2480810 RepID=A0A4V2HDC7_9GAMM|nr:Fic family protein [Pseudoxanthomonas winnipegensis]
MDSSINNGLVFSFCPRPLVQEVPCAETWLDASFFVSTPQPIFLKTIKSRSIALEPSPSVDLVHLALLSMRLSFASHNIGSTAAESAVCDGAPSKFELGPQSISKIKDALFRAKARVSPNLLPWLIELSRAMGNANAALRSNRAWVGSSSPNDAWLVLPRNDVVGPLLENLSEFIAECELQLWTPATIEALAFQLIHIHPLKDGNGRCVRALLAGLALRHSHLYPLFLMWTLLLSRVASARAWASNSILESGKEESNEAYRNWLSSIKLIDAHLARLVDAGVDRRLIRCLLTVGCITPTAISAEDAKCSSKLAEKLWQCAAMHFEKRGIALIDPELNRLVIDAARSIVVKQTGSHCR